MRPAKSMSKTSSPRHWLHLPVQVLSTSQRELLLPNNWILWNPRLYNVNLCVDREFQASCKEPPRHFTMCIEVKVLEHVI